MYQDAGGKTSAATKTVHATKALEETHDYIEAAKLLLSWCQKDVEIWKAVTQPVIDTACYEAIRRVGKDQRSTIWNMLPPNYDQSGCGERLLEFANSYLDFPLPGGKLLKDARATDLKDAIEFYSKQAKDMKHKADWLKAILDSVGNKKVGTVFTNEKLAQLKEKVAL